MTVPKPSVEVTEEEFQHELEQLRESRATIEPVEEDRALGGWRLGADHLQGPDRRRSGRCADRWAKTRWSRSAARTPSRPSPLPCAAPKPGQELKAEVIYPADYAEAKLAGKTVAYEVEVKAIKKRTLPELDDEFAKELGAYESLADLESRDSRAHGQPASGAAWKAKPRTGCLPR